MISGEIVQEIVTWTCSNDAMMDTTSEDVLVERAIELARTLLQSSLQGSTRRERRRLTRLANLLEDDAARGLIFSLTDEVLRFRSPRPAASRFAALVRGQSTKGFGAIDALMLRTGARVARMMPSVVMPLVIRRIRMETDGMVISADDPSFANYLKKRRDEGARLNVNLLGEAILSDSEADERMRSVCDRISRPDVDYVSVKISAIVANLDAMAFDKSLEWICDRLRIIYRLASDSKPSTFINLDMEEYRDLELTLQSFMRVLSEPEFVKHNAGIVLQAYLPDSHDALERLGAWAADRHARGGGFIKVRLVKGANLAMETVEAEMHCWESAPYSTKEDVDASYKRLLSSALRSDWADVLRIGVASHNLFDVSWALVTAEDAGALDRIEIEMLEGMAPSQARVLLGQETPLLMYSPTVSDEDFAASIAYLTRRLDENTQPDNFLRALFSLRPDSSEFEIQAEKFRTAVQQSHTVSTLRKRHGVMVTTSTGFANEPDGDATDANFRSLVQNALGSYEKPHFTEYTSVSEIDEVMGKLDVSSAIQPIDFNQRRAWLLQTADVMANNRAKMIGALAHSVGKTLRESDPEISEAIDFCRYYAEVGMSALESAEKSGHSVRPCGTVLVVGPWNFPFAIPVGGVAAALAAGNSVVLKPAPESIEIGALIVEQFHAAGVPPEVLQLVVCPDNEVGQHLVTHELINTVVLTGSFDTSRMFLGWKETLRLFAETSGKNALIVTASADVDQAIADLVRSAFGHAGQKCSAASLGIIEASLYDDPDFMSRLADAARSIRVLPATNPASMMGPVINEPTGALQKALTVLEAGESWLVEPKMVDGDVRMWTPGIRTGVQEGSWFHLTECFGPVLGLMRAENLDHAIQLQNATSFGLTGGIHSLDDNEIQQWLDSVEVGNIYVNRHITGAVVQRQPFGGWKQSSVGGGAKAGGPDYVAQFATVTEGDTVLDASSSEFANEWAKRLSGTFDPTGLTCEANILRSVPLKRVCVRHDGSDLRGIELVNLVARITGVELVISDARSESESDFLTLAEKADRVRLLCPVSNSVFSRLHAAQVAVSDDSPVLVPEVELRHWSREQSIARTLHRHGRITVPANYSRYTPDVKGDKS